MATADNPIATAIVDRAAALTTPGGDRDELIVAAAALHEAGCRYQWARTLVLLGGADRVRGEVRAGGHGGDADGLATQLIVVSRYDDFRGHHGSNKSVAGTDGQIAPSTQSGTRYTATIRRFAYRPTR